jgi:hypothetical protein
VATGSISMSPGSAVLPDGTTTNAAPALQRMKSSSTAPAPYLLQAAFDASTEEWLTFQFRMPDDYASAPVAKIQFKMTSATSGAVVWGVQVTAITPGDAVNVNSSKAFATVNTATTTVPGTVGYLTETSIALANADSVAAGDFVVMRVARVAADGSDTATGDAELVIVGLSYTTT